MITMFLAAYLLVGLAVAIILGCIFFAADEDAEEDRVAIPFDGATIVKYTCAAFAGGVVWPVTVLLWTGVFNLDRRLP